MTHTSKTKIRLIVNCVLMVFTLFALIISVVAWFSTRQYAEIREIHVSVTRNEIIVKEKPERIELKCATKIGDAATTPDFFNSVCLYKATYVIQGDDGKLVVEVGNDRDGLLGYVCDGTENGDYYTVIYDKLKDQINEDDSSKWQYDDIYNALCTVNRRAVGEFVNGDTEITVIFWAEYDEFQSDLEASDFKDLTFNAKVKFIA